MKSRIRFFPQAREELEAAAAWYDERRPGLGVELVAEIDEAVGQISDYPEGWPLWRDDRPYRKRLLSRFPYVLFFVVVDADEIEIVAVAHSSRRPGYWLERA